MSECIIYYNGKKYSEWEFDLELRKHEGTLSRLREGVLPSNIFSISPKDDTIAILDDVFGKEGELEEVDRDAVYDPEDSTRKRFKDGIGVNRLFTIIGSYKDLDKSWITEYDEDADKLNKERKLIKKGYPEKEAEIIAKNKIAANEIIRTTGIEFHAIVEHVINNNVDKLIRNNFKYINTPELFDSAVKCAERLVSDIKKRFPNCEIFSEKQIVSKKVDPTVLKELEVHKELGKISRIEGCIDILVIDEKGHAHIIDIKTSKNDVGDWTQFNNTSIKENEWSSIKKLGATIQVSTYAAILAQYGIKTDSCDILPIKIILNEDENSKCNGILGILYSEDQVQKDIPQSLFGEIASSTRSILPNKMENRTADLQKVNDLMSQFFPQAFTTQGKLTAEYYKNHLKNFIKEVKPNNRYYKEGYRYYFREYGIGGKNLVYCKTKEELNKKLNEYVNKVNTFNESKLGSLADMFEKYFYSEENENDDVNEKFDDFIENIKKNISIDFANAIKFHFKKYALQLWEPLFNKDLNNNGIFVFRKGNRVELVLIDSRMLGAVSKVNGHSTNIFGEDDATMTSNDMRSFRGNIMLMKAAALIKLNKDQILQRKGDLISTVKVINPSDHTEFSVPNYQLVHNWNRLVAKHLGDVQVDGVRMEELIFAPNENNKINKHSEHFMDDLKSFLFSANDIIETYSDEITLSTNSKWRKRLQVSFKKEEDESEIDKYLTNILKYIKQSYKTEINSKNYSSAAWRVYNLVSKALLYHSGYMPVCELDVSPYLHNWSLTGLYVTSISDSKSANALQIAKLADVFRNKYNGLIAHYLGEWNKLLSDAFKESNHHKEIGDERPFFRQWLREDENGELDPKFLIKERDDIYWLDHPKAWKAAEYILNLLKKFDNSRNDPTNPDKYYAVPLMRQKAIATMRESKFNPIKIVKSIGNAFKDAQDEIENVFLGESQVKESWEKEETDPWVVYNRFLNYTWANREDFLKKNDIEIFEKDLDIVFRKVLEASCETEISKEFVPLFNAFKVVLQTLSGDMSAEGQKGMKDIIEYLDKWIKNKIYNEPIMDKSLRGVASKYSVLKNFVSTMTLGLSSKIFAREALQSSYRIGTRAAFHQIGDLTKEDVLKACVYMAKEIPNSFNNRSFIQQLQQLYYMANFSKHEIADSTRLAYWGIKNFNSSVAFQTSSACDYYFRTALLVAKMMKDGCFEAHSLDANDIIHYDMTKDKRFSAVIVKNNKVSWNTNVKGWKDQKDLYDNYINTLINEHVENSDGRRIQNGDVLPNAYPSSVINDLRTDAGILLGHFDSETKALISSTFLGSIFLQFKTYGISILEQNLNTRRASNRLIPTQQYDENGKKLYLVIRREGESKEIGDQMMIMREGDEGLEEAINEGRATLYILPTANPIEGTIVQTLSLAKALINGDQETLDRIWKDPINRGRIWLFMLDNIGLAMMALLIKLIYGEDGNDTWLKKWSYTVLMGATEDGPIWKIAKNLYSTEAPALGIIKKMARNTGELFYGGSRAFDAAVRMAGATSELAGLND